MRSEYCGQVNESLVGETVTLCGWADRRRDHGGVIFVDLRDHKGVVQIVMQPDHPQAFEAAQDVRYEFCLKVTGIVRERPKGQENQNLASGQVEVLVENYEVLNRSAPLPFQLDEEAGEEIRLRYRYLDLRRPKMQSVFRLRSRLTNAIRHRLEAQDFLDIETPILTKATPEGARDYLVPSRVHHGHFYALPQSPQLFKQLLMMSGMDRYYQIARCFRDEDLRADRQPEFTQLDIEMAFVEQDDVTDLAENLVRDVFKDVMNVELESEFPKMTYAEAMRRFGSDKPDLRNPLELVDVSEHLRHVEFKVFAGPANASEGRVAVLKVPQGGQKFTRKQIDAYDPFVRRYGAKGLAWIKVNDIDAGKEGLQSPIVKFLDDKALNGILETSGAESGDILFFGAGPYQTVSEYMGALRLKVGEDLGLVADGWAPLWVVDFPMFEKDARSNGWTSLHHPFTAPANDDLEAIEENPGTLLSKGYDMVLNGVELGGGSVRIHRQDVQKMIFKVLGISEDEANQKFGFLLDALQYGCPPHGGIAFGIDRMCALMCGVDSIREVIAFPKTAAAACQLTGAPSPLAAPLLREVHIQVAQKPKIADS